MRSHLSRAGVAAVALTAATHAGALAFAAAPADAAVCSTEDGVSVVVDFHGLGGGVQQVCDADGGGKYASAIFTGSGFDLTYVQNQPGFVCQVDAKPADDPCVNTPPADAYWGLWWSDGTKGKWTYSTLGVGSLKIPEGGSVAFSWNNGSGQDKPGVAPPVHETEPAPSPSATDGEDGGGDGGDGGDNGGGNGNGNGGATATPTPEPTDSTSTAPAESESASPTPTETEPTESSESEEPAPTESETPTEEDGATTAAEDSETTDSSPDAEDGGIPGWMAAGVVVLLFAAAGAVAFLRSRRSAAGPPAP